VKIEVYFLWMRRSFSCCAILRRLFPVMWCTAALEGFFSVFHSLCIFPIHHITENDRNRRFFSGLICISFHKFSAPALVVFSLSLSRRWWQSERRGMFSFTFSRFVR
jgi:hypothetical protein